MRHTILHALIVFTFVALLLPGGAAGLAQAPPPDPRFGIVESYVNSPAASQAGAGYTRIIFRWDLIQPGGPGDWKPANVPDPYLEAELAAGREVVAVLIGTPAWATADGSDSRRAVPDMSYWEQFVRRMAQQYRGRIKHWIVWNEPDVWDVEHPGATWAGSEQDYYRLLKTAYLALKNEDPSLQVHLAGLTYFWDWQHGRRQYLDRLLDVIAADPEASAHGYYFDAVVYHLYFNPRQTMEIIGEVQGMLGKHGMPPKPIWINETNAPPSEDSQEPPWSAPRFRISLEEQSAFVIQEFALAFAAGAERVEFYKLRNSSDHPESIEPYGLLRADDSRRPAFDAYQVVTTYLRDFRGVYMDRIGDVYAVTFDRGGATTTVLWTAGRTATRFTLNAIAPQATLVDERGNTQALSAEEGTYSVDLPPAACSEQANCFIGGPPRLLVEAGSPAGRPALVPVATPTATSRSTEQATPSAQPSLGAPTPEPAHPAALSTQSPALSADPGPSLQPPTAPASGAVSRLAGPPEVALAASPAATGTPRALAQNATAIPSPQPTPTPLPPFSPLSIFTPARCLILIIVGLVVFTVAYGIQVTLWWRRRR
jgi:hypothetical protein